jgi:hypothetical protein
LWQARPEAIDGPGRRQRTPVDPRDGRRQQPRERVRAGHDAVQLASALALGPRDTILATWDRDLSDAALDTGLAVARTLITDHRDSDRRRNPNEPERPMGRFDRCGSYHDRFVR